MYTLLIVPTVVFVNANALPNLLFTFATAKLALNDLALAPNLGKAVFVFALVVDPVTFNGTFELQIYHHYRVIVLQYYLMMKHKMKHQYHYHQQ